MAFFKFRKKIVNEPLATTPQTESVEMMRRRAKHRLLGAAVLVLLGVVGFPLLFDQQPRPIPIDISIEIPDKNKVKPLNIPPPVVPAASAAASAGLPQVEEKVAETPIPASSQETKAISKAEPKPTEILTEQTADQAPLRIDEAAKVQALLEDREPAKKVDARTGRYVVQVGAFADATRAREVRLKVEHAGLKTYTQVAETKDGRRIRVRVGPFAAKAEADKAVEQIKKLNLPAAILTL